MLSYSSWIALAAASLATMVAGQSTAAEPIPSPTGTPPKMNAMEQIGCFSSQGSLVDYGPYDFQTAGNCQPICYQLGKEIMALSDGSNCYCGDLAPPKDSQVEESECSTPCNGYDKENCGGKRRYQVTTSGLSRNEPEFDEPVASSSPTSTPTAAPEETVVETVPAGVSQTASAEPKKEGSNTAAIAAGVVVGVVVVSAIIGGFILFMKRRRRIQAEESYKRHASVSNFVGKPPGTSHSSINDTRLDPEAMMRRQSDGSIADNQDYSRRILQVRNF